uniref:Integrase catalytic domain-containing protein n=1 Tax=Heliothis virescens TaxID=7102 RepID=A0A2A4K9T0_HELVI
MIIQEAHRDTLHGGARLTLAYLRLKYWIIGGNRTIKKELRQCIRCHRFKPHRNMQLMSDLPRERVTPSRPFTNTGVDFTGHVDIKINKGRGVKTCKAYIAIFICMVTKAVHLELVSDLTTQTFLAAFKRMCARRGTPKHMFSDNGTNFVGAAKLLYEDFEQNKTFKTSEFYDEMNNMKIQWHFNAPLWPSAGGLWEAAVKSMKYHLKRVLGEQKLTYEQFTTLLTQIEACLNSRPLCPLSEDVEDLEYLTPGHFLVGGPLLSPAKEEEDFNQFDLRNRWRLVEQTNLHIWKRWSNEYLQQLQVRSKWQQPKENLAKGDLVLVHDENLPPGRWALGRVVELHPGTDGKVRVVTLKTKKGQLKRPIVKLSPLPIRHNLQYMEETENEINKQEPPEPNKQKKQRSHSTNKHSLLSLLLLCMMTIFGITQAAPSTTNNYKVTSILNNQPIYFDEAGKLQLIHDEWSLLIFYNLTSYWQATSKIKFYIDKVDILCQQIVHEYTPCKTVVDHLRYELNHLTEYNSILLSQHSRQKRGYFDGIGKLARTLFGVLDLMEQLNIISGKLPQGVSLPIKDIQKDFQDIYELIHGSLKLVQPLSAFIAINLIKNSYITLEEEDMHHCTAYGEDEYTCISNQPVYSFHDKDAPCEAKVFSQQTSLACVINNITCKETWIKLHKPNVWLFTLCDKQLMRVICSDQVTPAVIDGIGVIALAPKCLLQKKDATIFTYNHMGSNVNMELDIEIPTINSTINNMFDLGWRNAQLNITELRSVADVSKIERQISYQKQQEVLPELRNVSPHDIYFYSTTSLLLGGFSVVGIYLIIKKWKKMNTNATPSTKLEQQKGDDKDEVNIEMREIRTSTTQETRKGFCFDNISSN